MITIWACIMYRGFEIIMCRDYTEEVDVMYGSK